MKGTIEDTNWRGRLSLGPIEVINHLGREPTSRT